jgi:hypothetical protein
MGGLPAMHVNTTLTILISALYADARFCRASSAPHEETGSRTCSPLCFKLYQRWWLRKRPHVQAVASAPNDAEAC